MSATRQQPIATDQAAAPFGPYNQGIRWGDLIFTASVGSQRPGQEMPAQDDIRAHVAAALENIKAIVEAGGGSLDTVLRVTVYLRDMNDYAALNEVYTTYFTGTLPARSMVSTPGARWPVGFDAIAHVAAAG
jgi:2-iminobutanoate/2-iminopropanoate deaminase